MGLPRRHHIVTYFHKKINETATEITQKMNLDHSEVDACTWLCSCLAHKIVTTDDQFGSQPAASTKCLSSHGSCWNHQELIAGIAIGEDGRIQHGRVIPTAPLFWGAQNIEDNERVSTGTKYALKLWLADNGYVFC